jgi:hypothetical protein
VAFEAGSVDAVAAFAVADASLDSGAVAPAVAGLFHKSECLSGGDNDAPETRAANPQVVDTRPDAPISRVLGNDRYADVSQHT